MNHTDSSQTGDQAAVASGSVRQGEDITEIRGHGEAVLRGPDGEVKQRVPFENLITQVGDQVYAERGAGIGAADSPTGMRLGTGGATTPTKTGAGAAIDTYVAGSNKGFEAGYPQSSLNGASRRISFQCIYAAGEATANGINEAVITNETPLTDSAGAVADTMSRLVLSPTVNKGALDTLTITWSHDSLGA